MPENLANGDLKSYMTMRGFRTKDDDLSSKPS
jgi:hypothetical protein